MRYQKYSFAIMLQGLVLALGISVASQFAMGQDVAKASSNDLKGNAQCTRCHDDEDIHPPMGSHATADCATCHKGGADHLVSRKNAAGKPDAAACLTCHKDDAKRMTRTSSASTCPFGRPTRTPPCAPPATRTCWPASTCARTTRSRKAPCPAPVATTSTAASRPA